MRLLKLNARGKPSLTKPFADEEIPPYAILSHTWGADEEEVTFNDLENGSGKSKAGYAKLQFCGKQAQRDGLQYFWVDTCCIDKTNHNDLSKAITSMFRWYHDAVKCYVYLSDVSARKRDIDNETRRTWELSFRTSRWFTRGWTLQELLAPKSVEFYSREEERLGNKTTLVGIIHEITSIPVAAIRGDRLSDFSVDERLRWAAKRDTKEKEDKAYCLLGIFGIFMPLLYGEGRENALRRLRNEIDSRPFPTKVSTQREELVRIAEWLTPANYSAQQIDNLARRQDSTGLWLINSKEYSGWFEAKEPTVFCQGIPGAGKTVMSAIVADHLRDTFGRSGSVGIACLFCSYKRRHEQKSVDLMAGLLKQLLHELPAIPEEVKQLYERHCRRQTRPSFGEFSTALSSAIRVFSRVFFIIDALDECANVDGDRNRFVHEILKLQDHTKLSLFATSRSIPDIQKHFEGCPSLEIRASDEDVDCYLDGQMSRLPSCVLNSPSLRDRVKAEIIKAVDGMFLLAKLHLDSLIGKTTPKAVKSALEKLPKGSGAVDHAYTEAMERIRDQKVGFQELARQVLSWLACATRPLTTLELRHALAVELGESKLDEDNLTCIEDVVSVCAGLVTIDEASNVVRLVHYTTQEYFQRTQMTWFPHAQRDIGRTCITYLSFDVFKAGFCAYREDFKARLQQNPLFDYAAQNWGHHLRLASAEISHSIRGFFEHSGLVDSASQALTVHEFCQFSMLPRCVNGVHLAAYFGLTQMLLMLLDDGWSLEYKDSEGSTAIFWAVAGVQAAAVKLLIDQGAILESLDKYRRTALFLAAEYGHETMVELLLENGAVLQSPDWLQFSPLTAAAARGHEPVVKLLLEKGANLRSYEDAVFMPLTWATHYQLSGTVKLLLLDSIKSLATMKGYQLAVELLSKNEEAVRIPKSNYPLVHLHMLSKLVDYGKSKRLIAGRQRHISNTFSTALFCAASMGFEAVAKLLLLVDGIDVDFVGFLESTPLLEAARKGHVKLVKLLLENGAAPNISDRIGLTGLSYAEQNGHDAIAELLRSCSRPASRNVV